VFRDDEHADEGMEGGVGPEAEEMLEEGKSGHQSGVFLLERCALLDPGVAKRYASCSPRTRGS
jgi:hypothetical protein